MYTCENLILAVFHVNISVEWPYGSHADLQCTVAFFPLSEMYNKSENYHLMDDRAIVIVNISIIIILNFFFNKETMNSTESSQTRKKEVYWPFHDLWQNPTQDGVIIVKMIDDWVGSMLDIDVMSPQIEPDCTKNGQIWDFLRSVSVHFGSVSQNVRNWS